MVFIGIGEDQKVKSKDMNFYNIDDCVYFAQRLHQQGKTITAYCLPKTISKNSVGKTVKVY